ncbi:MAG: arginine N-succinyltransferase [Gammaproteobacteria bacterium]|jgi:arginine N-succinyltransferase|nr:arginine N-succinyltransferase [Gammaproteobacteria bacterium]MDP6615957.1 arginine N-succinyltransferase [Gammaproteobacteria bacterium]MDP6695004.1 arginine N-succinyltransferase [Gammaproteobacteria bacterium]
MSEANSAGAENLAQATKGFSGSQVALIVLGVIVLTAIAAVVIVRVYVFPSELVPVTLSVKEEARLDDKLRRLGRAGSNEPEAYSEAGANREISLSEKEVNSLIGGNPGLAKRVAIDLSNDLASAKILVPIPEDFPVMPGQILRVNAGLEVRLDASRKPVVALRGVSIMGVPIPNAWLGNLKNVDLVSEFGDRGFWKAFADGVDDLQIRDGEIYIKLRE